MRYSENVLVHEIHIKEDNSMFALTVETDKEMLEENGYQVVEDEYNMKTRILKDGEVVTEISVNKRGALKIKIQNETKRRIRWVSISITYCPRTMLLEAETLGGGTIWAEIPPKAGQPVFWQ